MDACPEDGVSEFFVGGEGGFEGFEVGLGCEVGFIEADCCLHVAGFGEDKESVEGSEVEGWHGCSDDGDDLVCVCDDDLFDVAVFSGVLA